jgi:hypothetical protein
MFVPFLLPSEEKLDVSNFQSFEAASLPTLERLRTPGHALEYLIKPNQAYEHANSARRGCFEVFNLDVECWVLDVRCSFDFCFHPKKCLLN